MFLFVDQDDITRQQIIQFKTLLAQGDQIGYSSADCYVAVFNTQVSNDKWYLGTQVLQDIVVVFHNTAAGQTSKIGIAPSINKDMQFHNLKNNYWPDGDYVNWCPAAFRANDMSY